MQVRALIRLAGPSHYIQLSISAIFLLLSFGNHQITLLSLHVVSHQTQIRQIVKMLQPCFKWALVPARQLTRTVAACQVRSSTTPTVDPKYKTVVGDREVVGFGINGQTIYYDNVMFPYPAIRFKTNDPHLQTLREKEKGDWKKLSIEEKKQLYRASFRQTFEEMNAPTGEYKSVIGFGLIFTCIAILSHITLTYFIYDELPQSYSEESQRAQLRRVLDLRMNPVSGISSKWDYEKDDWKADK